MPSNVIWKKTKLRHISKTFHDIKDKSFEKLTEKNTVHIQIRTALDFSEKLAARKQSCDVNILGDPQARFSHPARISGKATGRDTVSPKIHPT